MRKIISFVLILLGFISIIKETQAGQVRVRGNGGNPYGCVTPDTLITLANNQTIPIKSLESGIQVFNQDLEKVQTFYTIAGPETSQMFLIETETGKSIKATRGHPFYSDTGVLAAKDFKIDNYILTIDGLEKVTKISTFLYGGHVYNLAVANVNDTLDIDLELKDPFLGLTSREHTIILNGFISGDVIIQKLLAQSER